MALEAFWYPGHYIIATGDQLTQPEDKILAINGGLKPVVDNGDIFAGAFVKIKWKHFEPTAGNYTGAVFERQVLEPLQRAGKKLVVEAHDRTFSAGLYPKTHARAGQVIDGMYPGPQDSTGSWYLADGGFAGQKHIMPKEWTTEYRDLLLGFIDWFGSQYANESTISAVVLNEFNIIRAPDEMDTYRDQWEANKKLFYRAWFSALPRHVTYQAANHMQGVIYSDDMAKRRQVCTDLLKFHLFECKGGLSVPDQISVPKDPNSKLGNNCFHPSDLQIYTHDYALSSQFFKDKNLKNIVPMCPQSQLPSTRTTQGHLDNNQDRLAPEARGLSAPEAHIVNALNQSGAHMMFWANGQATNTSPCSFIAWNAKTVVDVLKKRIAAGKPIITTTKPTNVSSRGDDPGPPGGDYEVPTNLRVVDGKLLWDHSGEDLKQFKLQVESDGETVTIGPLRRDLPLSSLDLSAETFAVYLTAINTDDETSEAVAFTIDVQDLAEPSSLCVNDSTITWGFEDEPLPSGYYILIDDEVIAQTRNAINSVGLPVGIADGEHTVKVQAVWPEKNSAGIDLTWTHPASGTICKDPPATSSCTLRDPLCIRPQYVDEDTLTDPLSDSDKTVAAGYYSTHAALIRETASVGSAIKVAFLGDSITARWQAPAANDGGIATWNKYFDAKSKNLGRGGERIQGAAWRLRGGWANTADYSEWGYDRAANSYFRNWTPNLLVLLIGTNNNINARWPGTGGEALCKQGIFAIAQRFVGTINPNGVCLVLQIPPPSSAAARTRAMTINALMTTDAPAHQGTLITPTSTIQKGGIYTFPTWQLLANNNNTPITSLFGDGVNPNVHPNAAGYKKIAEGETGMIGLNAAINRILSIY